MAWIFLIQKETISRRAFDRKTEHSYFTCESRDTLKSCTLFIADSNFTKLPL